MSFYITTSIIPRLSHRTNAHVCCLISWPQTIQYHQISSDIISIIPVFWRVCTGCTQSLENALAPWPCGTCPPQRSAWPRDPHVGCIALGVSPSNSLAHRRRLGDAPCGTHWWRRGWCLALWTCQPAESSWKIHEVSGWKSCTSW